MIFLGLFSCEPGRGIELTWEEEDGELVIMGMVMELTMMM